MRHAATVLLLLMLVGCSRGVDLTNASTEEVAKAMGGAAKQQPGQWETMTELEAVDLGKAGDPKVAEMMKQQVGQQQVNSGCLSPQQAATPALGNLQGASCRFDRFVLKGGRMEATMRCTRPEGAVSVTQKGAYSATAYDLRSTLRQQGPNRPASSMTMHMAGRRTGECKK